MRIRLLGSFTAACLVATLVLAACSKPAVEPDPEQMAAPGAANRDQSLALERIQVTASRISGKAVEEMRVAREAAVPLAEHAAFAPPPATFALQRVPSEPLSRENYAHLEENGVFLATENPVSTFSVDVDTGAYANIRRWLNQGSLPPADAVRIEEMLNYFDYDYAPPANRDQPFRFSTTLSDAPWKKDALLLRIGIKGYDIAPAERPAANLVFLVDVSGSMQSADKLALLKQGLGLLLNELDESDRISLVVYAGASGVVLHPTPGNEKATIRAALAQLQAGGSTNGASGIRLAYDMAQQAFIDGGINRVILATDGDFNVGTVNHEELVDLVERRRATGITLTTLGFGTGNYNDHLMEQLANKGNGNYAYIDTLNEARKMLVEEMNGTLLVIAKDVKAQIEFNPDVVAEYRLVGYENRVLAREDFNNDKVDAGDIGAGHTVTALYEVVLADSDARRVDDLRYGTSSRQSTHNGELAYLKLRYKLPDEDRSRLLGAAVRLADRLPFDKADADFRFAAAVAAFGQQLKGGKYSGSLDYTAMRRIAADARGEDRNGYRGELLQLLALAESLDAARRVDVARAD